VEYIRSNSDCEKSQRKPLVPLAENHLISQGDVVGRKCDGRMLVRWTQCIPLAPKKIDLLNASPTPSPGVLSEWPRAGIALALGAKTEVHSFDCGGRAVDKNDSPIEVGLVIPPLPERRPGDPKHKKKDYPINRVGECPLLDCRC
jgi:hypothetical protein